MHLFDKKSLVRLLRDDSGATAIEYGLIAALIAVAAVATGSAALGAFAAVARSHQHPLVGYASRAGDAAFVAAARRSCCRKGSSISRTCCAC